MSDKKQNKLNDLTSKKTGFPWFLQCLKDNLLIGFGIIGVTYFILVTYLFVTSYSSTIDFSLPINSKAFGEYGDHVSGIGAILAFIFAFATFWRIEASNKKKDFETTFFNMLHHFDSIINQIKVSKNNRIEYQQPNEQLIKEFTGVSALNILLEDFLSTATVKIDVDELHDEELDDENFLIQYRWKNLYHKNLESLPHYFRYYYTLVKFIMKSDKGIDKKYYADLLQAMISSTEMALIFYNTFYNDKISIQRGAQEFQKWLNDPVISLLENIDAKSVLSTDDLKAKCPNIKFKFDLATNNPQPMNTKIKMGNDEFILYIRKTSDCRTSTKKLGKQIWVWLKAKGAKKLFNKKPQPCYWGDSGDSIKEDKLPKDATQFEFDRSLLPSLYNYLDELKQK